MKATVCHHDQSEQGGWMTTLATDYGRLVGQWEGTLPAINSLVHVELDFELIKHTALDATDEYKAVSMTAGHVSLTGVVESAWLEGVVSFRIGPALLLVEVESPIQTGSWLMLEGVELRFYNENL